MSQQQELWMSGRDRDRIKVLNEVERGHLTQKQAGGQLGITDRWVRKLLVRMRKEGDGGILHRLRGRRSNHRMGEKARAKAIRLVERRYGGFGPTLASEYLAREHELKVSRETLRKWLMEVGLWKRRRRRVEAIHTWRPRRSCWGELVQWDTSEHDWLEGRGEKIYLIVLLDDATSRMVGRFVRHDSTEENLRLMGRYVEKWGRPRAVYTDKAGLFRVNRPPSREEDLAAQPARTQVGRALAELGIEWIAAHSPQAKGRIERCFGTLQDRLVKGLRLAGAKTLDEANTYLEKVFLPEWDGRFTVPAANPLNAHRPLDRQQDLAAILSQVESRVVLNDYTLRFQGESYQMARAGIVAGLRGSRVRVEKRLDGTVAVRFRNRYLPIAPRQGPSAPRAAAPIALPRSPSPQDKPASPSRPKRRSSWMQGFHLADSPSLWMILQPQAGWKSAPREGT
jgi:transposase